jgi:HD-GYP domain-containing protein (c-di-GMP phosphodiesterase class II)
MQTMIGDATQTQTAVSRARRFAWLSARIAVVIVVLAAVTVFLGPFAAVGVVCLALWAALFAAARRVRAEQRNIDLYLAETRDVYDSIIGVLCGALYLKDDMNAHHVSRVSHLAAVVASEMGMRRDEIRLLQKAAILADIGKIEIAQGILTKPGALSDQEWKEMKRHPQLGNQILAGIPNLQDAAEIVVSHHERFDGQGYPNGLKGEEIPLGARIFGIVDAYTAMTSDRPHRKKMSHEVAMKEILRHSLTQFDPEVVRAFVRCEERGQITERTGITEEVGRARAGVASAA